MSHYDILGVPRNASASVLRESYHAEARKYHPDRSSAPDSEQRFLAVQRAWETLRDDSKRAQYDVTLDSASSGFAVDLSTRPVATWVEVQLTDMEQDEEGSYIYECRCGDYFEVFESDLAPGHNVLYLPCGGCSLKIKLEATRPMEG